MNLGAVAEPIRLPDSADSVVVVEPTIGSTSRTKGSLFLLVTATGGRGMREATKLVADRIRDDYYYDLSAGISVCLRKAVQAASRSLMHSPNCPPMEPGDTPPIGVALAVVRGNELYIASLGPAEAYLMRQARLLTLPDSRPDAGLPTRNLDGFDVWHGEITPGDCLMLISPNVTRKIGLGPVQDCVLQLHPQAAVDEIHRQLSSGLGATGGDGCLLVEASEVPLTHKAVPLKPVWPNDSLAGAPDRSPIPLADAVGTGLTAAHGTARHARVSADGWVRRSMASIFDRLPERRVSRGRVTPMLIRRERRQRTAIVIMALLLVTALAGTGAWFASNLAPGDDNVSLQQKAQQAFAKAKDDVDKVYGNGRDLMASEPNKAYPLLKDAYEQLEIAEKDGYPAELLANTRNQTLSGLNQYYNVASLQPKIIAKFGEDELTAMVKGPDGAAYVLDSTDNKVYRVNLETGSKIDEYEAGRPPTSGGGVPDSPRLLAVGGRDVLILDSHNALWRWREVEGDTSGTGSLIKWNIPNNVTWGSGVRAIGTFLVNDKQMLYNLYIVTPSMRMIWRFAPALDGSQYSIDGRTQFFPVEQDVSNVDDLYVDAYLYVVRGGTIQRYAQGQLDRSWKVKALPDKLIRPKDPVFIRLVSDSIDQNLGTFYAYDNYYHRVISFDKTGKILAQYVGPSGSNWLSTVKGMFVATDSNGANPTLFWIESGSLLSAPLQATGASPEPEPTATPSGGIPSTSQVPTDTAETQTTNSSTVSPGSAPS
jgi:hypothetical protein